MRSKFLTPEYFRETARIIFFSGHEYAPKLIMLSDDLHAHISTANVEDSLKIVKHFGLLPVCLNTQTRESPPNAWQRIHDPIKLIDQLIAYYARDVPPPESRAPRIPHLKWLKYLLELFYEGESIENCLVMHQARQKLLFPEEVQHRKLMQEQRAERRAKFERERKQRAQ